MADSILELLLRIKKTGTGGKDAKAELDGVKGSSNALSGALKTLAGPAAVGAVVLALKESVTAAANWGDEMGDLAALTGQTVPEMSHMAATLELVGIKSDTLKRILKSLSADGINLNMESLIALKGEYDALEDPVARNKLLFDRFGKSAVDLAEVMGRSKEELMELADTAKYSGKVIDEEAAAAAEQFNVELATMEQMAEGAKITIGNFFIPTLIKAADAIQLVVTWESRLNDSLAEHADVMREADASQEDYEKELRRAAEAAGLAVNSEGDLIRITQSRLGPIQELVQANYILTESERGMTNAIAEMSPLLDRQRNGIQGAADATRDLTGAETERSPVFAEAIRALGAFNIGEAERIALETELKIISGELTIEDILRKDAIGFLTKQLELGNITQAEYIQKMKDMAEESLAARDAINQASDAIRNIPDRVVRIDYQVFGAEPGGGAPVIIAPGNEEIIGGAQSSVSGPPTGAFASTGGTINLGGVTINISGAGDPKAVAENVSRILAAQARGMLNSGAAAMGAR